MAKKRTKAQRSAAAKASWARRRAEAKTPIVPASKPTYKAPLLNSRETTHGDYTVNAGIAQGIKAVLHGSPEYLTKLSAPQKESAELIATKFGRIVSGDPNFAEHWEDIAGYATLIAEQLRNAASAAKK